MATARLVLHTEEKGHQRYRTSLYRCAPCLSAERAGQLDFDSALWVLGACVCNYFPRWILFKVFPSLPHPFLCCSKLATLRRKGFRGTAARLEPTLHVFLPPGHFLNKEVPTERMNLHVDRLQTCLCVCQREKLIKEKKLIIYVGRRVIETACDLPRIGASLVGLGFT